MDYVVFFYVSNMFLCFIHIAHNTHIYAYTLQTNIRTTQIYIHNTHLHTHTMHTYNYQWYLPYLSHPSIEEEAVLSWGLSVDSLPLPLLSILTELLPGSIYNSQQESSAAVMEHKQERNAAPAPYFSFTSNHKNVIWL